MIHLFLLSLLHVAVSIAPLKGILEEIGGEHLKYDIVYPVSANPHMYEPRPGDILKVKKADLFVYAGRAEPGGRKLCRMAKKCISIENILGVGKDVNPHVWLSPELVKKMADSLATVLSMLSPDLKDTFQHNAVVLQTRIDSILMKAKYRKGGSVLLMHGAFVPLFKELGFDVVVVSKEPGMEPGARRLKELSDKLEKKGIVLGVCEKNRPCKIVKELAEKFRFRVVVLDPLYSERFTVFLKKTVSSIENATNSSN